MFIGELAERTGVSIDTLRWYEKTGLIPPPLRDQGRRRVYSVETVDWVGFLLRLKATGMTLAELRAYADLRRAGATTSAERRARLEEHRDDLRRRMALFAESLAILDRQIEAYRAAEAATGEDPGEAVEACPLRRAARTGATRG
ncbi:MAG: MerR family transcriptional regulator [Hyphomicrobiales bacterium]|nr:MerR family transcriptional regulator [Hyphomicrobiales bacterium]